MIKTKTSNAANVQTKLNLLPLIFQFEIWQVINKKPLCLKNFWDTYHNNQGACYGGIDFARVILEKSIGVKKTIDIALKEVTPEVLREIERVLEKKLSSRPCYDYCLSGGMESVEEILECVNPEVKKQIVNALK